MAGNIQNRRNITSDFTIGDMITWYLDTRDENSDSAVVCANKHPKVSKGTMKNFWASARNYVLPEFMAKHPSELDNIALIKWESVMAANGAQTGPRQKALSLLRMAFIAARDKLMIDANMSFPDKVFSHKNVVRKSKYSLSDYQRLWHFLAVGENFTYTAERKARELQRATRLLMLTGARKSEITKARWSELEQSLRGAAPSLVVDESRQKSRRNHHIVLSTLAEEILQEQYRANPPAGDDDFIFEYIRPEMCLNRSLTDQGKFTNTVHDIRRTTSTCWGACSYADKLIELSLGHLPKGVTRRNYNQYEYLLQRREMMEDWSQLLLKAINTITTHDDGSMWGATDSIVEALDVGEQRQLNTINSNDQGPSLLLAGAA